MLFPDCAESSHDYLFATQFSPSNLKGWQADDSPNIPKVYFPCHTHLFINKFHKSGIIYRAKAVIFYSTYLKFDLDKNNAIALFYTHFLYALLYGWVWRYSTTAFSSS